MKNLVCFHIGKQGRKKTYCDFIASFNDLIRYYSDGLFIHDEDEGGNQLPNKECCIKDCNGNVLVQGLEAMTGETGVLDFDGDYNTSYVKDIKTCTDEELQIIVDAYNSCNHVDDDVLDFACDKLGYTHIYSVKGYPSNVDVFTNVHTPAPSFGWENRDFWQGYTWEEFTEFVREELHVLKWDEEKLLANPYIAEWFD